MASALTHLVGAASGSLVPEPRQPNTAITRGTELAQVQVLQQENTRRQAERSSTEQIDREERITGRDERLDGARADEPGNNEKEGKSVKQRDPAVGNRINTKA